LFFYWVWVTGNATDAKCFYVEEEEVVGVEPFDKDDERNVQTAGGGFRTLYVVYTGGKREITRLDRASAHGTQAG
jgi:hypothetical protein